MKKSKDIEQLSSISKGDKLLKYYTYQLPENACSNSTLDSIVPYVNHVYRLTQKKEYHEYVGKKEVIQEGDTLFHFRFRYPRIIHGENNYIYNKQECKITFIKIYTGKF